MIRAGLIRLGASVLEDLLAADPGYSGPRAECGCGHRAGMVSRWDKTVDTVLGQVVLRRAWYHCTACGHGHAPRDAQLGTAGQGMSAGLRKMCARAAAAVPFAAAARLVGELAGLPLTGKKARDLQTALGYFEHNAHRMCYAHFRKLGMFAGSGAVEAGCKAIVAQRCKLSGMRWTLPGA